ncbi:MAG: GNAT family N-acetyltransferase [Pedobacter sp.]|nr:MAG: GNAT family N-acetyltransferase [Pedobacter sp.]
MVEQIFPSLTWRIRQEAMYPDKPIDFVKLEDDFEGIHFAIYLDHELSGVVSLFISEKTAQFRKLAVRPQAQHQGLGSQLMTHLIAFCKIQKLEMLWCNARTNATTFYENLGFYSTEKTYSASGFDYVRMELLLD